jgi:hypothetical protein
MDRALEFDKHWGIALRKMFGCPLVGDTNKETCSSGRAVIDYVEFGKAREMAKILFDLGEKNG